MNITKETDVIKLKALAYDELAKLEQAQNNLKALNYRIAEVEANKDKEPQEATKED